MSRTGCSEDDLIGIFAWLLSPRWMGGWTRRWYSSHPEAPHFRARCFDLRVTLWCLIWQRLRRGAGLQEVVGLVHSGKLDGLAGGTLKLSRRLRSRQTSAYSDARQRLPLALVQAALAWTNSRLQAQLRRFLGKTTRTLAQQRPRCWVDGSTLRVLKTKELEKRFPVAGGRRGKSDWSLLRVCVAFCAHSGAALHGLLDTHRVSEQALAWSLMSQAQKAMIWVGDRNFGVWSVVAQARSCGQDVVVRLTRARARALLQANRKKQSRRARGERWVSWCPHKDQVPPGCTLRAVEGRLVEVSVRRGRKWVRIWLFTTLQDAQQYPVELLVQWYGERWGAELNFRHLKTHLDLGELHSQSPELVQKEFYVGLLAYNVVRILMWKSAPPQAGEAPSLSFAQARATILDWMEVWSLGEPVNARRAPRWLRRIGAEIARCRLPRRRGPRPCQPRRVRCRPPSQFPTLRGSRAQAQAAEAQSRKGRSSAAEKPLLRNARNLVPSGLRPTIPTDLS